MQNQQDYKILLKLARETISAELNKKEIEKNTLIAAKKHDLKKGVFVTIYEKGVLRGCIGQIIPVLPLWQTIIETAKSAAFHDPRFNPLQRKELPYIKIEISILSPLQKLKTKNSEQYLELIDPKKHGIFIESETHKSGILLPQVFIDRNITDPKEALQMTCQKANLHINEWKKEKTSIYTFTVKIIKEN